MVKLNFDLHQLDVNNVSLGNDLNETMFMVQSAQIEPKGEHVYQLKKSILGSNNVLCVF